MPKIIPRAWNLEVKKNLVGGSLSLRLVETTEDKS